MGTDRREFKVADINLELCQKFYPGLRSASLRKELAFLEKIVKL